MLAGARSISLSPPAQSTRVTPWTTSQEYSPSPYQVSAAGVTEGQGDLHYNVTVTAGCYLFSLHVCSHDMKKVLAAIRRNGVEVATLFDQVCRPSLPPLLTSDTVCHVMS